VTPEELAERHPRLFHVTLPKAVVGIRRHGLLSTSQLLDLFEVDATRRTHIGKSRRPARMDITHPVHGRATITDNLPLTEKASRSASMMG
jgi:hypothetical protein